MHNTTTFDGLPPEGRKRLDLLLKGRLAGHVLHSAIASGVDRLAGKKKNNLRKQTENEIASLYRMPRGYAKWQQFAKAASVWYTAAHQAALLHASTAGDWDPSQYIQSLDEAGVVSFNHQHDITPGCDIAKQMSTQLVAAGEALNNAAASNPAGFASTTCKTVGATLTKELYQTKPPSKDVLLEAFDVYPSVVVALPAQNETFDLRSGVFLSFVYLCTVPDGRGGSTRGIILVADDGYICTAGVAATAEEVIGSFLRQHDSSQTAKTVAVALQALVALKYHPELLGEEVTVAAASAAAKGFAAPRATAGPRIPAMIGRTLEHKHESSPRSSPCSHASPRTHWRRGHFHTFLCGEGRKKRAVKWVRPVLVNAA